MVKKKHVFLLVLAMVMVLGSLAVFAESNDNEEVQWVEEPSLGQAKNKKVDVHGRLDIPMSYKGPNKIKLSVGGFNVVPNHDGSFKVGVFKGAETEIGIKVFTGKNE